LAQDARHLQLLRRGDLAHQHPQSPELGAVTGVADGVW
jgi:hypothetical protein